ncbi:MAG: virulence protein RhuM/Fic/DOC family protein [bacterium]
MEQKNTQIIIYRSKNSIEIDVVIEKKTVWLSLDQIASLFERDKSVISRHIKNIFSDKELHRNSVVAKFATTAKDGKTYHVVYYNLDIIISVGYRVKSQKGVDFRIWATNILRGYLLEGYALNQKQLLKAQNKLREIQQTILFIKEKSKKALLLGKAHELLELIADYSRTFALLEQYDSGTLLEGKGNEEIKPFSYEEAKTAIIKLRENLPPQSETDGNLFGNERDGGLDAILGALYQTFGEKELYTSLEEKASHLLYLVIKDHPFSDGNKRIGSFLFIYFLHKHSYLYKKTGEKKINDNAMTALALLVAESNPNEKDMMILLIIHLIQE